MSKKENLTFGEALEAIKNGARVARKQWIGMYIYYVPKRYNICFDVKKKEFGATYNPYIAMKFANGTVSFWTPSTNDCLAEDYIIIKEGMK